MAKVEEKAKAGEQTKEEEKDTILGGKERKEKKEKETEEKEDGTKAKVKDSKAAVTFVVNGDIRRRIAPKAKEAKETISEEKEDSKGKDSKENAGHVGPRGTQQRIAQKERAKEKGGKASTGWRSQERSLGRNGERHKDKTIGTKRQNW